MENAAIVTAINRSQLRPSMRAMMKNRRGLQINQLEVP